MNYIERIVEAFYSLDIEKVPDSVKHQVRRALLDYIGCCSYTVSHNLCQGLVETVKSISANGESSIWGSPEGFVPEAAAFSNAARTSTIELDDVSGMGASVHPGVYVWSAAFASYEKYKPDRDIVLKAVLFGYELCLRMGLLSTSRVRDLGLHGPGLNGAFAAVATGGMIQGLNQREMVNAICLVGTLLPICPFISFMSGADSKDFYGGWGCYLGLIAANAAKHGLTGPEAILEGEKSLKSIYCGDEPESQLGKDFLIENIVFKEFSSCASIHPAMSALLELLAEHPVVPSEVEKVIVETYPFSYQLNSGVTFPLNPSSARLSLQYAMSVGLNKGALDADAFLSENLEKEEYCSLVPRVEVLNHAEYGYSTFSIRGAIVTVVLKNGEVFKKEYLGNRWSNGASDKDLQGKFCKLSRKAFDKNMCQEIIDKSFSFDGNLDFFITALKTIQLRK